MVNGVWYAGSSVGKKCSRSELGLVFNGKKKGSQSMRGGDDRK